MGLSKAADISLNDLIGYSKLQEVLELILSALREQEETTKPLQSAVDELRQEGQGVREQIQAVVERLDRQQDAISEAAVRLDSHQVVIEPLQAVSGATGATGATGTTGASSVAMLNPEQLQELVKRMDQYDELLKQLQAQNDELRSSHTEQDQHLKEDQANFISDSVHSKMNEQASALEKLISDLEKDAFTRLDSHDAALHQLQKAFGGEQGVASLQASLDDLHREMQDGRVQSGKLSVEQSAIAWVANEPVGVTPNELVGSNQGNLAGEGNMAGYALFQAKSELHNQLLNEIEQQIAIASKPLEAAIEALDAKIDSLVMVRIEGVENRMGKKEDGPTTPTLNDGIERKEHGARDPAQMSEIKQDISDLSQKLNEVISSLAEMGSKQRGVELPALGGYQADSSMQNQGSRIAAEEEQNIQNRGSDTDMQSKRYAAQEQLLIQASEQLEERVASLESKLANGPSGSNQDLTEMSESLQEVRTAARSLEGIVNKDVQPQLNTHNVEMRKLANEYRTLCQRIEDIMSRSSAATSTHCLACYDNKKTTINKVIIGRDGKAYNQGGGMHVKAEIAWPLDINGGNANPFTRKNFPEKIALQGGAGAPLRKYRIPLGTDGLPTWGLVNRQHSNIGAMDRSASTGVLDRIRGLPMRPTTPASVWANDKSKQ